MKEWRLADVATIDSGAGFPIPYQGTQGQEFPFLKVSDMNLSGNEREILRWNHSVSAEVRGKLRAKAFPAGSLIFPKIGAAIGTNKKRQLTRPSCVDNNVMAAVPNSNLLEADFLYFLFLAKNLSDFASDSNPPSIRKSEVEDWNIRVPPLPEQRRIVDILSRAESIVRLRREAQKKAAELIPALFTDLFGDPATNHKSWPVRRLDEVSKVISGATKGRRLPPDQAIELPYMRVANVKDGHLDLTEIKTIQIKRTEVERLKLEIGDLLMTEGGDPDKLGRAALWAGEVDLCVHQNHIFKVRSDRAQVLPEYLRALVGSAYGKDHFLRIAKKTTGIASINKTQLSAFPVVLPPLDKQRTFVAHVAAMESIQTQQATATTQAEATFNALLAQVFSDS